MLYLDPGTGSLVIQIAIAAVASVLVTSRNAWTSVKNWVTRRKPTQTDGTDTADSPEALDAPDASDRKDRDSAP